MPVYDIYPAVDEGSNFAPPVRQAMANSPEISSAIGVQVAEKVPGEVAEAMASDPTIEQAAINAIQDAAVQAKISWFKGPLPLNTNLKTFREIGLWSVTADNYRSIVGLPPLTGNPIPVGMVEIKTNGAFILGTWFYLHGESQVWYQSSLNSTEMNPWVKVIPQVTIENITPDTNLDEFLEFGKFAIPAGTSVIGLPEDASSDVGVFENISNRVINPTWGTQFFYVHAFPEIWYRTSINITGGKTEWVDLLASSGGGQIGKSVNYSATPASHELRVRAFKDEYPTISTENKGAVVFRYDHGLTNFKQYFYPKHKELGLKFYIAMNSRNLSIPENSGASWADCKAWIAEGLAEFGNHTADHRDRNTSEGIYDNIVNGRKELEAYIGRMVHGFTVPGLSEYNKFEGFGSGNLNNYSETLAGGLILANHGIASGVMGSSYRPLDGIIRQGSRHTGWEAGSISQTKDLIDRAVETKTALTLMGHPRLYGATGYWNSAIIDAVLEYVASLIATNKLANISYYQSHNATL